MPIRSYKAAPARTRTVSFSIRCISVLLILSCALLDMISKNDLSHDYWMSDFTHSVSLPVNIDANNCYHRITSDVHNHLLPN